jgi:hypothetical protein
VEHAEFHGADLLLVQLAQEYRVPPLPRELLARRPSGTQIRPLTEQAPNLVLEHLRAIRGELREIREEQRRQRGLLGSIERSMSYMSREMVEMGLRLDRMHDRLDRIE